MRLISLCPSITRLLFDLGVGEQLVGITKYCIHPAEQVATIEKVGGTKDPKLARIIELAPDVVFLNREENRREDWETLCEAGIHCNETFPETIPLTIEAVRHIGSEVGCEEAAATKIAEIEAAWARARGSRTKFSNLRWAYLIWRKPWMATGGATYVHHLISEAGGTNIFADQEGYPAITAEALADHDPHLVLLSSEPFPFKEKHLRELAEATGLPAERFVLCDGELMSWHGALTAQGLDYAGQLLASCQAGE